MDRNEEWNIFIKEIRANTPPRIDDAALRAILRAEKRKRTLFIHIPAAGACTVLVLFVTLANTSKAFSSMMKNIPFLNKVTSLITANPALR